MKNMYKPTNKSVLASTKISLFNLFFLAVIFTTPVTAHIGDTEAQCVERYGAVQATTPEGRKVYSKSGFRIIISFRDGFADSITYEKTPDEIENQKAFDEVFERGNTNLNLFAVWDKNSPDISPEQIRLLLRSNYDKSEWSDLLLNSISKDPNMPLDAAIGLYKIERDFATADGCLRARVYPDFHKLLISKKKSFSKAVAIEEAINLQGAKDKANLQGL